MKPITLLVILDLLSWYAGKEYVEFIKYPPTETIAQIRYTIEGTAPPYAEQTIRMVLREE